jgi:uncharacterized protein YbjT (DUF2867 family)
MLLSLLIGLGLAVVLSLVPGTGDAQHLTVQKPIMAVAWPHTQPVRASAFMQPARAWSMQPVTPYKQAAKPSALLGPGSEPEQMEQMPKFHGEAIVQGTPSRRTALLSAMTAASLAMKPTSPVLAREMAASTSSPTNIVVAGAAGSLGSRVVERLEAKGGLNIIGCVRNVEKAMKTLVKSVPSLGSSVKLAPLNVVAESVDAMAETLKGAQALVIAIGFVPGDPGLGFDGWKKAAEAVDNVGTIKLIEAAKDAGVKKVVMVSALLTDADAWGQRNSAVHTATNFFGGVLDQKLVAERYLRTSGLDYTILRAGGYTESGFTGAKAPGKVFISGENTLNAGEISRDLMADVTINALFDPEFNNKVVEVVERKA